MSGLKYYISKLKGSPLGLIKRTFLKTIIEPFKYGKKDGYKADRYWQDRFLKYGNSILGPGDETFSAEDNYKMYNEAKRIFTEELKKENLDFDKIKALEIGCGHGHYTKILQELGVKNHTAIDITDVLFEKHREHFPGFKFIKKDVSQEQIEGQFDLIVMIDVIEHIVEENKFRYAMNNIKNALAPGGIFLLTPVAQKTKKHLYYVKFWSLQDIRRCFDGYTFEKLIPFRISHLLTIKNNRS